MGNYPVCKELSLLLHPWCDFAPYLQVGLPVTCFLTPINDNTWLPPPPPPPPPPPLLKPYNKVIYILWLNVR